MNATMQQLKSPKNTAETIIDNTKPSFISPLELFIENNCKHCTFWKGKCRLEDSRGLTPMLLCITLSVSQPPPDLAEIMQKAAETHTIAEKTLQEASAEVE